MKSVLDKKKDPPNKIELPGNYDRKVIENELPGDENKEPPARPDNEEKEEPSPQPPKME